MIAVRAVAYSVAIAAAAAAATFIAIYLWIVLGWGGEAILYAPVLLPVPFVLAGVLSANRTGRSGVRVLAWIMWTTSIALTLACVAFAWWFFTSFELM